MKTGRPSLLNQNDYDRIISNSYMGLIDKEWIKKEFNVSSATAQRIINKLNLQNSKPRDIEIVRKYLNGIGTKEIGKEYSMSDVNVRKLLKFRNIEIRRSRYMANFHYFNTIDTEDKAYMLGFIYADGNLTNNSLIIALAVKDIKILEDFKSYMNSNHSIHIINKSSTNSNWSDIARLEITSEHIKNDLIKHGVTENKTFNIKFPTTIPNDLIRHFIRGYFDGDGCFSSYYAKNVKDNKTYINRKYEISIVGTYDFLMSLSDLLEDNDMKINKLYTRHPERNNNIRTLKITGKDNVNQFLDWIYKDSNIYLERKYKKYCQILK